MKLRYFILVLMFLFPMVGNGFSGVGLNLRPFYIMPTHGFYNGCNSKAKPLRVGSDIDIQMLSSFPGRGIYNGAGLAVHTFGDHELLGTPATLYLFQGVPLARIAENISIGYEWNLGVSAFWHKNGIVTASALNVYINLAALFTWRMNRHWDMVFGPEYTHFSNGDTCFPNGGTNTVNFRIGARRHFRPVHELEPEKVFISDLAERGFIDRISYDLVLAGGFRADRTLAGGTLHVFNKAFPTASLNFNPKYSINSYFSVGPSLDMLYDSSANLIVNDVGNGQASYEVPSIKYQISLGVSARMELLMPVFAVNIGIGYGTHWGYHTRYENPDLNGLYGIFALNAFLSKRLFLNVSYRLSSVLYSHNLMFGIGWRFGNLISHP